MKRLVLFSECANQPYFQEVLKAIFPPEMAKPKFAFIPANGIAACKPKYIDFWRKHANARKASFFVVDIDPKQKFPSIERQKIITADIVVISGGNTLKLAHMLRQNHMMSALTKFTHRKQFVLAGYSAGAILLTPSLRISPFIHNEIQENTMGNLRGLNLVNYEILPHYSKEKHKKQLEEYQKLTEYPVKPLRDSEFLVHELDNIPEKLK